jgi:hypothetical protein
MDEVKQPARKFSILFASSTTHHLHFHSIFDFSGSKMFRIQIQFGPLVQIYLHEIEMK